MFNFGKKRRMEDLQYKAYAGVCALDRIYEAIELASLRSEAAKRVLDSGTIACDLLFVSEILEEVQKGR